MFFVFPNVENGKSPEKKEEIEVKEEENHISIDSIKEDNQEVVEKEEKSETVEPKSRSASPDKYAC